MLYRVVFVLCFFWLGRLSWATTQDIFSPPNQHPAIQAYTEASFAFRNRQYQKALPLFQLAERLAPSSSSWQRFRVEQLRYRALCHFYLQGTDHLQQAHRLFSQFLQESKGFQHLVPLQQSRQKSLIFQESIAQQLAQLFLQKAQELSQKRQWSLSLSQVDKALLWAKLYKNLQPQQQVILWQMLLIRIERNQREDRKWATVWIAQHRQQAGWRNYRVRLLEQEQWVKMKQAEYEINQGKQQRNRQNYAASLEHFAQARRLLTPLSQGAAQTLLASLWYQEAKSLLADPSANREEACKKLRLYLAQRQHIVWHRQAQSVLWNQEQQEIQRIRQQRQYRHYTAVGWSLLGTGFVLSSVGAVLVGLSAFHFHQSFIATTQPDSPAEAITEPHRLATTESIVGWSMIGPGGAMVVVGVGFLLARKKTPDQPKNPPILAPHSTQSPNLPERGNFTFSVD